VADHLGAPVGAVGRLGDLDRHAKANVHIDLSGWSPKYFPPQLVRRASTLLKHKVLFGSDYPVLNPDRWMAAFDELEIKDEVRPLIIKENAIKLLRLR